MNIIADPRAAQIQAHHQAAHAAADKAIEHAKEAGRLLIEVKDSLPHGDFTGWVENHLTVSMRQAQRYMAAAQGRDLVRSKTKSDTVSFLTCSEPKSDSKTLAEIFAPEWVPMKGYAYVCADPDSRLGSYWVVESSDHPGYFHVSRFHGDDGGLYDGTRRPVTAVAVEATLKGMAMEAPCDASWDAFRHDGLTRPFGEPEDAWVQRILSENSHE